MKKITTARNSSAHLSIAARQKVKEKKYWLNMLTTDLVKSYFPYDHDGKTTIPIKNCYASETFQFSRDISLKMVRLSNQSDLRLNMILNAGVVVLLYKYGNQGDIIVGAPIYKQENEGDFLNTVLPLKNHVKQDMTFKEILLQVKQTIIQATQHQEYPMEVLVNQLKIPLTGKGFPLFDVVILLENIHDREYIQHIDTNVKFIFSRNDQTIYSRIEYNESLYTGRTILRLINHFKQLMNRALMQIETKISDLDILLEEERRLLLEEFNLTLTDYSRDKTIVQLFEAQAEQTPDNVAVVGETQSAERKAQSIERNKERHAPCAMRWALTYRDLNENANRLAHLVMAKGVKSDTLVVLMMQPSVDMIIAILGILKAGGAYLPIDPDAPINRILSVLEDSRASLVITGTVSIKKFSFISLQGLREHPVEPVVTSLRAQVKNLDGLQIPDRSLVDYEKYRPFIGQAMMKNDITLQFSRGCTYNCAYCFKIWPKNYVVRSAENMFEEILFYYKLGVRRFAFVDDLPNIDVKISSKLYRLIIKNKLNLHLHYVNGIRGDILTKEYIDLMVEAGTVVMDLALETTSPRLQKLIRKNLNLERLHENICYILEKYPHVILETAILHGIPTETREEAIASLEYIKHLHWIHFPYIHLLKIYPNTDMARIAREHGVSKQALQKSADLAYHEIPETLPFSKEFTRKYQSQFLSGYFLSKERLLSVLPTQMKVFTRDELVQAYDGYLPTRINSFTQLLDYTGISRDELKGEFLPGDFGEVPGFNRKLKANFPVQQHDETALRILLLDLSQYFTGALEGKMIYDVVEPPLGLMYLLTHLYRTFGKGIKGKIAKSRIDFDSFVELKELVEAFKPDVVGVRSLNFYRDFFHETISLLRQWGVTVPIIAGGPYATSSFPTLLADPNIDLAVLGEGEITLAEIIKKILDNDKKLPDQRVLKTIPGIAFMESQIQRMPNRFHREVLVLDRLHPTLSRQPAENLRVVNKPGDLSYIIYTSGSTGIPKGVMIQHNNLVNQISGLVKTFGFDSMLNYILLASFTFDVSVMHIFLPLTTGAKLFLMSNEARKDPGKLWRFMARNKISILNIVPAFMKAILENIAERDFHFKYLFVGGDVFPPDLYRALKETLNAKKIINIYGPTETTINATMFACSETHMEPIPIGKPLKNYQVYILDTDLNLVPPGVTGELCIAGEGVCRGYLNNPELTAEKFIEHRSYKSYRSYIYKTGDLTRWLPDGNIQFLGRIDQQVKIRGFRIEPGEIENHLLKHEAVKDAVVITGEDQQGNKNLYAYYVAKGEKQPELWPSIGEYFIWDDLMYYAMTHDERRNKSFKAAINRLVKNKTVVEVGTGQDAILARFCIEAGAKKVYAVEILEEYLQKAKQTIKQLGMAEKIILIHGDIRDVELPEKVDICLANQCGTIGSSEGAVILHNHARRFLQADGTVIPHRCLTKIAAVSLPDNLHRNPGFTELPGSYVEKIFKKFASPFDLRVCVKNFPKNSIISDAGTFEYLAFQEMIEDEAISRIHLTIDKDARLDGFLLWLNLYTAADELIDTLAEEYVWLPVFIPVFYPGIRVLKGDCIEAECMRYLSDNDFSPDYKIKGRVLLKNKEENLKFEYESPLFKKTETQHTRNPFYGKIIHKNSLARKKESRQRLEAVKLREYLAGNLPGHMIPSYFVQLEKIPLTSGGKVDKQALPEYEIKSSTEYEPPGNEIEKQLVKLWTEVLSDRAPSRAGHRLIGIDDNFFHLGGHSLKATILISRIHKKLEVRIPLLELFKTPTIRGISEYIKRAAPDKYTSIQTVEKKEYYAVSSAQKRLYILHEMEPESTAYNMPETIPLLSEPDLKKLRNTFERLIERHESLRTSFHMVRQQPVQRVQDKVEFEIENSDFTRTRVKVEEEEQATDDRPGIHLPSEFIRPFDLSQAPLLRVGLQSAAGEHYLLLVDMHHIISDGISHQLLVKDFTALYNGSTLPPLRLRYKDFSQWQNSEKEKERLKHQELYWLKEFEEENPVLNLPTDDVRPAIQSFEGNALIFEIGKIESRSLKNRAREEEVTLFILLLAVTTIWLSKLSGQEAIVIGTPTAGRRHVDLENIIGMFVNTIALKNFPNGEKTFRHFLQEVKKRALAAFENQDYHFEDLVDRARVKRDTSRNPLFDVMFSLDRIEENPRDITPPAFTLIPHQQESNISKFDLSLSGIESEDRLYFHLEYCTKLFREGTMQRFTHCYKKIISQILMLPGMKLSGIEIITREEKRQILFDLNDTTTPYPQDKTLHRLLEEQLERIPDHIALIGVGTRFIASAIREQAIHVAYRELNRGSQQLAWLLKEKGVKPDTIVGIMAERSVEMIIGILGILKAGGAYLPIDPDFPEDRIDFILKDSGTKILVTTPGLPGKFKKLLIVNCQLLMVNEKSSNRRRLNNPLQGATPHLHLQPAPVTCLAYVLYTSGSTGKPKAVMVQHRNVMAYIHAFCQVVDIHANDIMIQQSSYSFDTFVEEIYPILCKGAKLAIPQSHEIKDLHLLVEYLTRNNITILDCSPLLLNELNELIGKNHPLPVRTFISGGDVLKAGYIDNLLKVGRVYNGYGPTETTVCITFYQCPVEFKSNIPVPIGKPLSNYKVYILDKYNNLLPFGVPGELCAAGDGVTRGYLNNPELTAEKFDQDGYHKSYRSYMSYISKRLYKTGDLARWLQDGNIEFLGRIDHQVKIRGYRIELKEIEQQLLNHDKIKNTVVVEKEDESGDKYLCAYIVPHEFASSHDGSDTSTDSLTISHLRNYLSKKLPVYMLPSYFMILDKISLLPNGKVDRKALPNPRQILEQTYTAPRNEIEKKLVEIWSEILNIGIYTSQVSPGIDNNFFELGGHSLKATAMVSRIFNELQIRIPLAEVFKTPTVRELAQYIQRVEPTLPKVNDKNLVLLRWNSKDAKPLFFVHDGTGEVEAYVEFCKHIKSKFNFNCWGIRADRLNHYSPRNLKVEKIAPHYIKKIKKIQPHGPYYMVGYCIGGNIAFEIVRQLEQKNETIQLFLLIDSPPPREALKKQTQPFTLRSEVNLASGTITDNKIKEKLNKCVEIEKIWPFVRDYLIASKIDIKMIKKIFPREWARGLPNFEELNLNELIYYMNMIRTFINATSYYVPSGKLSTPMHYIVPDQSNLGNRNFWNRYCRRSIKYHKISGDHFSIFKKPGVCIFAEKFGELLNLLA